MGEGEGEGKTVWQRRQEVRKVRGISYVNE